LDPFAVTFNLAGQVEPEWNTGPDVIGT
jgi:hypothetical protein